VENKINIEQKDVDKRLDLFLQELYPEFSRAHIQNAILSGGIYLLRGSKIFRNLQNEVKKPKKDIKKGKEKKKDKAEAYDSLKNGEKLKVGDLIVCNFGESKKIDLQPQNIDFEIVYEDSDLAVINKPRGLVVHPCLSCTSGTLVNGLLYSLKDLSGINGEIRPGIVHRLDKDTCGLLLVAKNDRAHVELSKQLSEKTCSRKYLALIEGTLKQQSGRIEALIARDKKDRKRMAVVAENGKIAVSEYRTVEYLNGYSLVEFTLKTGRTHQIRVHAKYLNHPIVGDLTYGGADKFGLKGQFLCAYQIAFIHPTTKKQMSFQIDLPDEFKKILENLR
jgi:23S rRNA pseudouridine1911/1915/1917 synthase